LNINLDITRSGFVHNAHCSFVATARCARNIADATLDTVAALGFHQTSAAAQQPADWSSIARGIVRGAIDFGANLHAVGQGMMLGAIRNATSMQAPETDTIRAVAQFSLHEAIALGGDFEAMATGLASGATEGGREIGNAEDIFMTATAEGARVGAEHSGFGPRGIVERAIKNPTPPLAAVGKLRDTHD